MKKGLLPILVLIMFSCSEQPEISKSISKVTGNTDPASYDATEGLRYIDPRAPVSAFLLDEAEFKINGTQVGLQDYLDHETPVVNYLLPKNADYVEILRCPSEVALLSRSGKLINIMAGSKNVTELTDALKETNFWKQAEESTKCSLIASEYNTSEVFHDESAPSRDLYYLVRACVSPDRLSDTKYLGKRNCSYMLGVTIVLEGFKNLRSQKNIEALDNASQEKRKMDSLGREIYTKTVDLNNVLYECEKKETERKIRVARKGAISKIIGLGLSIGASIYTAPTGMGAKELFKTIWETKDDVAGRAVNISGVISDLTSDPDDFPRSCVEHKKLLTEIYAISQDFKLSHEKYSSLLDSIGR
jgi:hypothetical protein